MKPGDYFIDTYRMGEDIFSEGSELFRITDRLDRKFYCTLVELPIANLGNKVIAHGSLDYKTPENGYRRNMDDPDLVPVILVTIENKHLIFVK